MLKKISLFGLVGILLIGLTSANQKESEYLSADSYQYKVAKQVFDQLISAKGDKRLQVPEFVMSKKERYVAWMNGKKAQIGLEEKAYEICVSYGKDSLNAMAALLGHEIIHYYEKHNWGSEFASAYTDVEIASDIKTNTKTKEIKAVNETEADYLGGFLAHSAGYKTFGIMPNFLNDVYKAYGLSDEIPGYPSLGDRSKLAVEAEQRLEDLVNIYQLSNHMTVLNQYEDASVYYSYVLKEFQSREIYNNAGVNAILEGLSILPEDHSAKQYEYPLQLDGETRMNAKTRGNDIEAFGDAEKAAFEAAMKKAIGYFEQAKALDKDYGTAYLNLACAYDILEEAEDAIYWARKAKKIGKSNKNSKVIGDAQIINAIASIHNDEMDDAKELLAKVEQSYKSSAALATLNLKIAETGERPFATPPSEKVSLKSEKIEGFDLNAFLDDLDVDQQIEVNNNYTFASKKLDNSVVLLSIYNGGDRAIAIQLTNRNFQGNTASGMSVGTSKQEFLAKYGEPTYTKQTRKGEYLVYEKRKAIFQISDDKLSSWSVYRTL